MAGILEGSEDLAVDKGAEVPVLKGFMAWGSDNKNIHRHKTECETVIKCQGENN